MTPNKFVNLASEKFMKISPATGEKHLWTVIVAVVFLIDYRLRVSIFNQQLEHAVASAKLASIFFFSTDYSPEPIRSMYRTSWPGVCR